MASTNPFRQIAVGLSCLALIWTLGCSANSIHKTDSARNAFAAGDLTAARENLQALAESKKRSAISNELDLAIVDLADGNHRGAEGKLRALRDKFDSLPKFSPIGEAASIVTDDNARPFRPASHEQVMVRTMLALCSLAGDGSDAEAYSLQAFKLQNEFAQQAHERGVADAANLFQPIAIAPYLRGMIREATYLDYDDAARAYALVQSIQPDFAPAAQDSQRAATGVHCQPGHGVLYVLACVGRGPVLTETTAPTTTEALKIASLALQKQRNDERNEIAIPNIASVKIPTVIVPPSRVASVDVSVEGKLFGTTQTLTDVGELAANQLAAEMPWTIARAVVRRVSKEAAVAKVSDSLGLTGNAQSIFQFATASVWSRSEGADLRCWGLLPREIQVLRAELPAGTHRVLLTSAGPNGKQYASKTTTVSIGDGSNKYLVVIAPDEAIYLANEPNATSDN